MVLLLLLLAFSQLSTASIHKGFGSSVQFKGNASLLPTFTWIDSSSIHVVLPNGIEDVIQLWPAEKVGDMFVPCLFEGKIRGDNTSSIAVSGCQYDDKVNIVIYTILYKNHTMFNINNGIIEEIGNVIENQAKKIRKKRDSGQAVLIPPPPPFLLYDVKFGYEESFLAKLGSHEAAKEYIIRVFTLAKKHLGHPNLSLGTRIRLRAKEPITFIPNLYLEVDVQSMRKAQAFKEQESIPITYFCDDKRYGNRSIANIRRGCDERRGLGIHGHQDDIQLAALSYLHDMGHWVGFKHDKEEDERSGSQCDGTGIMGIPEVRPVRWSSCSVERFPKWYHKHGSCLKIDTECGEGTIFPSCDECEGGWFGYPDCKQCSCSPVGSKNETCNKITGKCHCKDFYYGRSCAFNYHPHAGKNLRLDGSNSFISPGSSSNPPGSWPWGVSIGWLDGLWHHYCSGVIVSATNIITTANCLSTLELDEGIVLSEMMIRAGDNFLKGRRDDNNIQTRNFLRYKIHPGYEFDYHYLDIAVITLKTPLEFNTKYVRPVYLPSHMESKEKVEMENRLLTISGWGKGGDGKEGETLKDAVVAVFSNEYCISNYNGYRLMDKHFKDDVFCGGNPVDLRGVCVGDDGSPAVMLDHSKNVYTLVGLLSMSNRYNEGFYDEFDNEVPFCGSTATPNIFVRIASESIVSFLYKEIHGDLDPYLPEVKTPLQCGRNAIVDGTFSPGSNVGKWPWMVSIGRPNPDNLQEWLHECGGSVVSENKVITAAHCVQDYANFSIRAGDSNLKDAMDDGLVQSSLVRAEDIHKNYDPLYRYFDIAVLTLATNLTFTTAVQPVCLNTLEDISEKNDETFSHLVTSGWGNGDQMRDTAVMVFSESLCNRTHENRMDNYNLVPKLFTNDLLCAGDPAGESGTCQGDSGGPAVYFDATKKRYFLRAVISGSAHGICGSIQFPNIYVRVESKPIFVWIKEMMNKQLS